MTTIVVVISYEKDARKLADIVRALGISVMGIYSHDEYRDGVRYFTEPEMQMQRNKWKLVDDGYDCPVKDFG